MARPPNAAKAAALAAQAQQPLPTDRLIQVSLNEYLTRQAELANTIKGYQMMATQLLTYISQQVGSAQQAMTQLQKSTQEVLDANQINAATDGNVNALPGVAALLRMDSSDIVNPFVATLQSIPAGELSNIGVKVKKQKKPRKAKDPNAPTRPQTAFFLYQMANREKLRERMKHEDPDVKPGDVQKKLTETWNSMNLEQQKPYKDQYHLENELYNARKREYERSIGKAVDSDEEVAPESKILATSAPVQDASGDAESTDTSSSEESDSESDASPSPPPKKSKDKSKKHRDSHSDKKKKRKHIQEESSEEEEEIPKKRKKDERKKKKRSEENNIDPELRTLDKEQRKNKHVGPDYAPATQMPTAQMRASSSTQQFVPGALSRLSDYAPPSWFG